MKQDTKWRLRDTEGKEYIIIDSEKVDMQEELNKTITKQMKEIERLNNKIERGLTAIDIVKDIIIKQPSSDNLTDLWILSKLEGISNCLKDSDKE